MNGLSAIANSDPGRSRVLVAEEIGNPGVALLHEHFDVELGIGWSREQLAERIGEFDGVLIRSATKLDADLLALAKRLRAVGRAGVGVDNVDVAAATKRGFGRQRAAVERDHRGRAHDGDAPGARPKPAAGPRVADRWEVGAFEVLGRRALREDARHPRVRPDRPARRPPRAAFAMRVIAFDPFVAAERYRESGVEKADSADAVYASADFITLHLPNTPDTKGGSTPRRSRSARTAYGS